MNSQELRSLQEAYLEVYECYSSEQLNEGLISIWQTLVATLAFLCYWANGHCCKWPNIE